MRTSRAFGRAVAVLLPIAVAGAACGSSEREPRAGRLVVFAASSLREAFTALSVSFRRAHPGVEVTFDFAGSQELRTQIEHGAPADVFASADTRHMEELESAHRVEAPVVFAENEPVVAVAREAAAKIRSFEDLARADRIVIGAPEVPIGRYTLQILDRAEATVGAGFRDRVLAKVASRELNVRQVLAKVTLGEAEAGIVYRTDVAASPERIAVVEIPAGANVIAEYPIARVAGAAHPELARAWVDLVRSPEGQRALSDAGFLAPAAGGVAP